MARGTTADVIGAFIDGQEMDSHGSARSVANGDGSAYLVSYSTIVAKRLRNGAIAVSPYAYSATTAKLLGQLLRAAVGGWSWSKVDGKPYVESARRDWVSHSSFLARVNDDTEFAGVVAGGRGGNAVLPFPILPADGRVA